MSETEINRLIAGKTSKYTKKWGNASKVGVLINSDGDLNMAEKLLMSPRNAAARNKHAQFVKSPVTSR